MMSDERILVIGSNGYVGNALVGEFKRRKITGLCVDAGLREKWVSEVGGCSLTQFYRHGFLYANVANPNDCLNILQYAAPTVIIHLASQPSGPYSDLDHARRVFTQTNNLQLLLNLAWISRDLGLNPKLIVTTTTGIPGAPDRPIEEAPTLNLAGSSYHVSRGFDSANLSLLARQTNFRILEMRTSIVYGTRTQGMDLPSTRLDWDYWFGTVVHRFCLMKKMGKKIPVFGKGLQRKPFISLADCVESLVNAVQADLPVGHTIVNQTTGCFSVLELAEAIGGEVEHRPNPRKENEDHQMKIVNQGFRKFLGHEISSDGQHAGSDLGNLRQEAKQILADIDTARLPQDWEPIFYGLKKPGPMA